MESLLNAGGIVPYELRLVGCRANLRHHQAPSIRLKNTGGAVFPACIARGWSSPCVSTLYKSRRCSELCHPMTYLRVINIDPKMKKLQHNQTNPAIPHVRPRTTHRTAVRQSMQGSCCCWRWWWRWCYCCRRRKKRKEMAKEQMKMLNISCFYEYSIIGRNRTCC